MTYKKYCINNIMVDLDIFAIDGKWNVHILGRKIVIREFKMKHEEQNVISIFWSSKICSWSTLAAEISWLSQNWLRLDFYWSSDFKLFSSTIWFHLNRMKDRSQISTVQWFKVWTSIKIQSQAVANLRWSKNRNNVLLIIFHFKLSDHNLSDSNMDIPFTIICENVKIRKISS